MLDRKDLPITKNTLDWEYFTTDLYSTEFEWKEIVNVVREYPNERIDLRPYMIHTPYTVMADDHFEKIVEVFRSMHLRHLPVLHPRTGKLIGIISRRDIFKCMNNIN
jgi:predicted transcriptional regulator